MRNGWLSFGSALVLGLLIGCSGGDSTASGSTGGDGGKAPDGKKLRIAVIPKGATHEFWKSVHEGASKAGDELGVEIIWKGPLKEDDRESQINVVDNFISTGVDGMVLAPLDDQALVMPVANAVKQEIPVVIIDSGLKSEDYVSFVSTDNYKAGQMAGEEMVRLLGGKGNIIVLRYQEGSASTDQRESGFLDAVKKAAGIKVVSENQYAGATTETAQKAGENLLASLKAADGGLSIQGIFTPNESSTFGMLRVLQDNGWAGKVKFIGFDASAKLLDGLKSGQIDALVLQNPKKMGYEGVKAIVNHIKGTHPEKRIDTGATLVTKENMGQPDVAELLAPPTD